MNIRSFLRAAVKAVVRLIGSRPHTIQHLPEDGDIYKEGDYRGEVKFIVGTDSESLKLTSKPNENHPKIIH